LAAGGRYCLQDGELTFGTCCDPNEPEEERSDLCKHQERNQLCATEESHKNSVLRNFVCPASKSHCPNQAKDFFVELEEAGKLLYRQHWWHEEIPTPAATNWHCKYHIRADRSIIAEEDPEKRGMIYLEIEPYGFD